MQITHNNIPEAISGLYLRLDKLELLLNGHNSSATAIDKLLTIDEAAEFLNLSKATLYSYTQRNAIPFSKLSKRLYFSQVELTEWIKLGRKKTLIEIAAEADSYLNKKQNKK